MLGRKPKALLRPKNPAILLVIVLALVLNSQIFIYAFPETSKLETPVLARDFSSLYVGAWRLFNNPTAVYYDGALPGDYKIDGCPQPYRYPPCFLLICAPFLVLTYQNALYAFDILQFLSVLFLAYLVYKLLENKPLIASSAVALIILVNPLLFMPSLCGNYSASSFLSHRYVSLHLQTFSPSYYSAYRLANAHVLQNTLLIGALYFSHSKKPKASALLFTFGSMDPRASFFSLPLLMWYNRGRLKKFVAWSVIFIAATNLPFFFYYGVGFGLFQTNFRSSISLMDFITYDYLPIFSVVSLSALEMASALLVQGRVMGLQKLKVETHQYLTRAFVNRKDRDH